MMPSNRKRLQLTPEQGLHRDFLMKRAAYLMRKTKRALAAYHAAKRAFCPSSKEEAEAQISTITKRSSEYFKRCAEEREAWAKIRAFDAMARDA
jgi:hypothetical protein